jgi:hypothetical protein
LRSFLPDVAAHAIAGCSSLVRQLLMLTGFVVFQPRPRVDKTRESFIGASKFNA